MTEEITSIAQMAQALAPHRHFRLFAEFLPRGYRMTTLSSVVDEYRLSNLVTKVAIGTIITLYDDLADHPGLRDSELLKELYQIPFGSPGPRKFADHPKFRALRELWSMVLGRIATYPHFACLQRAFAFDVQQFFDANRYAEMISEAPYLINQRELRNYLHHNMGIVLVGTVDLMCSPVIDLTTLGKAREIFFEGQRAARFMNMMATVDRELEEGDLTNELANCANRQEAMVALQHEMDQTLGWIRRQNVAGFSVPGYAQGLEELFTLHQSLRGFI